MFQTPKFISKISARSLTLCENTHISIPECDYSGYIKEKLSGFPTADGASRISSISFSLGIPDSVRATVEKEREMVGNDEEYVLILKEESFVYAKTAVGFLRALSTLMQLSDGGELSELLIYDYPTSPERGYRVYMPGRKTMTYFLEMVDFLVYYKFNALILEVGGAMEYERHPKINEKWTQFCEDVGQYSGRTIEIQRGYDWNKNSIHYENGDASYISKDECRELARYCGARGIEIIPECPSLSHSDYICHAYPEVAELSIDPYPDTYCPSNPRSYEILFDVLDEVIEVFKPKRINIGHDEYYLCALCDRCRGKDPADLYVGDIKKIKDYLDSKGVGVLMWGDKLIKARNHKGHKFGAWYDKNEKHPEYSIPNMTACVDRLPKGITYLHWYWVFGTHLDDEYHARNYPAIFGNFEPFECENFRTRINRGMLGAFVSNWGSSEPEYMQRNLQYFNLVAAAYALWSDTYDNCEADELKAKTYDALYKMHNAKVKNPIKVRHSTDYYVNPGYFWDGVFIEDSVFLIGNYEIRYSDGARGYLPVKYGTNIGTAGYVPTEAEIDYAAAEGEAVSERHLRELAYSTMPEKSGEIYSYSHVYENPYPEKEIESISYIPVKGKEQYKVDFEFSLN